MSGVGAWLEALLLGRGVRALDVAGYSLGAYHAILIRGRAFAVSGALVGDSRQPYA
jgi:hypothetical protein